MAYVAYMECLGHELSVPPSISKTHCLPGSSKLPNLKKLVVDHALALAIPS